MTLSITEQERKYDAERSGEIYIAPMTDAPARTMEDIDRAQIAAWNGMDRDERLFATIISGMFAKVPESHRAMGEAGMMLLTAACQGIGMEPVDSDPEEHTVEFAYRQGYDQGMKDGMEGCLIYLEKRMTERKAAHQ
jgi:hypothetical protein